MIPFEPTLVGAENETFLMRVVDVFGLGVRSQLVGEENETFLIRV